VLGGSRRFHTRSGVLGCEPSGDGSIVLDLPATPVAPTGGPEAIAAWAAALGLAPTDVVGLSEGGGWVLVELATAAAVAACRADREAIVALGGHVVVVADTTAADDVVFDSVCRTFVPAAGIDEDPVTGSAHCAIAPWLAARTGRAAFVGRQASARGGVVAMEVRGDRVRLGGRAVTVWRGELLAGPPA
jgi:predicted PhzF superfamily epimerase YddE/YHI9